MILAGQTIDDNTAHAHCMLDTQYVTYVAFPWQQWLQYAPQWYMYIACLILFTLEGTSE